MKTPDNIITSTANEKVKRIRGLRLKKNRDEEGVFVVEGAEPLQKALNNGWQMETLLVNKTAINHSKAQQIMALCRAQNALLLEVIDKVASYASNRDNPQDLIGVLKQKYHKIQSVRANESGLWLGLENIRDPGNLGSILRTADAVGVRGVFLIGHCCDAFSPEVIRASTGSFSTVPIMLISAQEFKAWRTHFEGKIIGTHLHEKALDYRRLKLNAPAIILMGGEQSGLTDEITSMCDSLAKIPMRDGVESLNLAVSTAIMLYHLSGI